MLPSTAPPRLPSPPDDHHGERVGEYLEIEPRVDAEKRAAHHASRGGQQRPDGEYRHLHDVGVDADAARHLGVVHRRAHDGAEAGALNTEEQGRGYHDGDDDHEGAVLGQREAPDDGAEIEGPGLFEHEVVPAPGVERAVLQDEREADCHQHLGERVLPEAAQEEALDEHSAQCRNGEGDDDGGQHAREIDPVDRFDGNVRKEEFEESEAPYQAAQGFHYDVSEQQSQRGVSGSDVQVESPPCEIEQCPRDELDDPGHQAQGAENDVVEFQGEIAGEEEKSGVREVHDPHHAEDEREPARQKK